MIKFTQSNKNKPKINFSKRNKKRQEIPLVELEKKIFDTNQMEALVSKIFWLSTGHLLNKL